MTAENHQNAFSLPDETYLMECAVDRICHAHGKELAAHTLPSKWAALADLGKEYGTGERAVLIAMQCMYGMKLSRTPHGIGIED